LPKDVWRKIANEIAPGITIQNWTRDKGFLGDTFVVVEIGKGFVKVDTPGTKNLQRIPREDFEEVSVLWQDYLAGMLGRNIIRNRTRYSKYIISILHSIEIERIEV